MRGVVSSSNSTFFRSSDRSQSGVGMDRLQLCQLSLQESDILGGVVCQAPWPPGCLGSVFLLLAFPLGTRLEIQKTCETEEGEVRAVTPFTWETTALECVLEE